MTLGLLRVKLAVLSITYLLSSAILRISGRTVRVDSGNRYNFHSGVRRCWASEGQGSVTSKILLPYFNEFTFCPPKTHVRYPPSFNMPPVETVWGTLIAQIILSYHGWPCTSSHLLDLILPERFRKNKKVIPGPL